MAADNGVATGVAATRADFDALAEADRNRSSVDSVDGCVNFAAFDTDNNGTITNLELTILVVTAPTSAAENCGATRGITGGAIDSKNFAGGYAVGMGTTATNLMTHIHEIAHTAMGMRDLYGFGVGALDISGPTCGAGNNFFMSTSAWQKMHWGWTTPTVVRRRRLLLRRTAPTHPVESFILYDYARGVNDYFMVENRQQTASTYDASASDSGLVIWRIDETKYDSNDNAVRPIEIMRADGMATGACDSTGVCYGGSNGDAWNPADTATPQRTMARDLA